MRVIAIAQGQRGHRHWAGEVERAPHLLRIEDGDICAGVRDAPAGQPQRIRITADQGEGLRHLCQTANAIAIEPGIAGTVAGNLHGAIWAGRRHGITHRLGVSTGIDGGAIIQGGVTERIGL